MTEASLIKRRRRAGRTEGAGTEGGERPSYARRPNEPSACRQMRVGKKRLSVPHRQHGDHGSREHGVQYTVWPCRPGPPHLTG